jgi:arginyl-tRNA synthetase
MNLVHLIKSAIQQAVFALYQKQLSVDELPINETKPEFTGDYTLVTFGLSKLLQKKPDEIAHELGNYLVANDALFTEMEVIKGFLNLSIKDSFLLEFLATHFQQSNYGNSELGDKKNHG